MLFRERFNLNPESFNLLFRDRHAEGAGGRDTYKVTWRSYCRSVLTRGFWYHFASCPSVIFYVNENKILAGREERGPREAVGRSLVVTFFESLPDHPGMVRRVERADDYMRPRQLTVAELLQSADIFPPHDPARSSAETEELLEEAFAEQDLRRSAGNLETGSEEVHVYGLADSENAEEAFVRGAPFESLTKIALARFLERSGLAEERRKVLWARSLAELRDQARPFLFVPRAGEDAALGEVADAAPAAGGRSRGRGRGRGAIPKATPKPKAKALAGRGLARGRGRGALGA